MVAADPRRHTMWLFGGTAGTEDLADLWEWNGAAGGWVDHTIVPRPDAWPAPRPAAGFAYDEARRILVLFGGQRSVGSLRDLWERATE